MSADPKLTNADLAPVGPERRTWNWWHIASLWIGMAICIPTYTLASSLVDRGWSWQAAVGSVVLGNFVVLIPMVLNSHAGTKYGIPFPVLARAPFGVLGANIPAMLRAVVACGWFGIQTWIGGFAIYKLLEVMWPGIATIGMLPSFIGLNIGEFVCFMLFWALQVWIVMKGMESIKLLETWGSPFLLAVGAALLVWAWMKVGGFGPMLANPEPRAESREQFSVFGAGLTSAVAFWGTMALSIPDFSRFARTQRDQAVGQAVGLPLTMAAFAFIGAAVTNASAVIFGTRIADPIALLARVGGPVIVILSMLGLSIATLTTNLAANVVAPANDFSNLAPHKINFKRGAMITALIGIFMMPWRLYNDAAAYIFAWLIGYGALLGPIAGIMIVDYFVLRKQQLNVDALYQRGGEYEYSRGFNWIAMLALALGIAPNVPGFLSAIGAVPLPPSSFLLPVYDWAWFVGLGVAAFVYYAGMMLTAESREPRAESRMKNKATKGETKARSMRVAQISAISAAQLEKNFAEIAPALTVDAALLEANKCLMCYDAPCTIACPTHIDVPAFIKKIASGNMRGSARVILDANPMGHSCARACPVEVLCEGACVLNDRDEQPIKIALLQRHSTDWALEHHYQPFSAGKSNGKSVAIVGAGPAGLSCARDLRRYGFDVTIYDDREQPGGLNTYGIAEYKMRQPLALAEVKMVLDLGVVLKPGVKVGRDITIEQLRKTHDALFIAVGLGATRRLGIPGEDMSGVSDALAFIEHLKSHPHSHTPIGKHVVVVGAGNTAIDAATQAKRLGAERVTLVYRRGAEDMSAYDYEFELAKNDGCEFRFLTVPKKIVGNGAVTGLECVRAELGAPGADGKRAFKEIPGSTHVIECDTVFRALGQLARDDMAKSFGLRVDGSKLVSDDTKVLVGGDCGSGGAEIVNAAADGVAAAKRIHQLLS